MGGALQGSTHERTKEMAISRAFEFIITIDPRGASSAWLVEDRKHTPGSIGHRTARISLDLDTSDIAGLTPTALSWRLVRAIQMAMENDPRWEFFSF